MGVSRCLGARDALYGLNELAARGKQRDAAACQQVLRGHGVDDYCRAGVQCCASQQRESEGYPDERLGDVLFDHERLAFLIDVWNVQ